MRPIDADKLKAKQQEDADLFIGDDTLSGKSRRDEALNAVANIINAPTIDAVPVVRCKDCKWYGRVDKRRFYRGMDCLQKHIDTIVPDRDFCSKAERRGEQDG